MTGIERLRKLIEDYRAGNECDGFECTELSCGKCMAKNVLEPIADQIERERACDGDTAENIRLIVGRVIDDMERHVLGHEGMEDSPVARWARELREALGATVSRHESDGVADSPYDAILPEDREAIAWVREHGGLDLVKASAHQGAMEHGYLLKVAHALGTSIYDGSDNADALLDKLDKRLMPEGMELDGNVLKVRTAENVDYDGETLFVLIGGSNE